MKIYPLSLGQVQAYLIETPAGLFLVDCGMPHKEKVILKLMQKLGRTDLKLIFITHAHSDHYGSAAALKRLTGAPIAIHRDDAPLIALGKSPVRTRQPFLSAVIDFAERLLPLQPIQADVILDDGDHLGQFGLPGVIVHTPGHTPGSSILVLEDHICFAGDMVSTNGKPHLQRYFVLDWEQLQASYLRLRELKLEKVYPGHGQKILNGDELARLIDAEIDSIRP